ncbi:MAG TPA: ribosome biogenesis GTPase Der, partial [Acidobacteriaceae bacterium]|nr:ribosome biogenesis GTPase Der [Acidobacteriaceae bacterium]
MPSKKSQKQQATRERSARNKNRRDANDARLKAKRQRASELGSRSRKAVDAETKAKQAGKAALTPNQRQKARAAARRIEPSAADLDATANRAQLNLDQRIDQHLASSPARAIFANQSRVKISDLPVFAICGRPNVGKSTLFNRLTGSRRSIVGDEPGITRDRIYGDVEWAGHTARLIDTGGIVPDDPELIPSEIFRQARTALEEAQLVIMVVDARTELASSDIELARLLIRSGKPVFLAVNKVDTDQLAPQAENFRRLGVQRLFAISAEHGSGIGDLLDAVFDTLKFPPPAEELADEADEEPATEPLHRTHGEYAQRETSIAIIGRPNVGKSTLLNALTNTSRAIVSPVAGTTRDAVDEVVEHNGAQYRFVYTAGIRRKGKTHMMAEKLSVIMARRHLEAADVALLIIDATEGVTSTDANIGGYAHESGRSVIIVVNKWDLVTTARTDGKPPADRNIFEEQIRRVLKYLHYAPIVFLSAVHRTNLHRLSEAITLVATERRKRVSTGQMNRFLERVDFQRATVPAAKKIRIYYMTQAAVAPPTFVLFTDRQVRLHFSYERFLENQIRDAFGFA